MLRKTYHFLLSLLTPGQWFLFVFIFALEIFLRFYQIAERNPFGWDQVDNAWAAKNIIINHWYPLVGMVAKQNSGFFIGPLYYYAIAVFYFFSNLDPIASGVFAGVTSAISFVILFWITKKLFSFETAIIACFIYTVASYQIIFDRVQWPVDLIPAISLLIFYTLYKVITGNPKYLWYLALSMGIMFQLHFTAVFFPLIVLLTLPFFPWRKFSLRQIAGSIALFLAFLIPNFLYELQQKHTQETHMASFFSSYYHGLHGKRVIQLAGDAFIQFQAYLVFPVLYILKFFLPILFLFVYLWKKYTREKILLCYLITLWFLVPWIVFAMYSGEISDYYFSVNRFIGLLIIAYLLGKLFTKHILLRIAVIILLLTYGFFNLRMYFQAKDTTLADREQKVKAAVQKDEQIQYTQGVPESYLFYYYMRQKGVIVYDKK